MTLSEVSCRKTLVEGHVTNWLNICGFLIIMNDDQSLCIYLARLWRYKDIEVTSLTFWGHVTSSVTWPLDAPIPITQSGSNAPLLRYIIYLNLWTPFLCPYGLWVMSTARNYNGYAQLTCCTPIKTSKLNTRSFHMSSLNILLYIKWITIAQNVSLM